MTGSIAAAGTAVEDSTSTGAEITLCFREGSPSPLVILHGRIKDSSKGKRSQGAESSSLDFSMEANNDNASSQSQSKSQQLEGEDRLSMLTDDILLSILGRVSTRMAATTSVLSTRWMHLPWLLPELSINVKEFLSGPCRDPAEENDMDQAMASLTKATWSFLAKPRKGSCI